MDIVGLDAVLLAAAIRDRAVSCVEVMAAFLDRIGQSNPAVNAIVALRDRTELLREAQARDDALTSGDFVGPLCGLPLAIKDLEPVRGVVTTQGSPILRDFVPEADSIQVARLRAAGAVLIGKTNVPEFGLGSQTYNPVYGVTRNPYDLSRTAGGSSGGAAAALALHMLPLADGSDYGGSLRNPAAYCNVFGLRPTGGRVPAESLDAFAPSMGVLGPLARSVPDLALLLSVQSGHDLRAPLSLWQKFLPFTDPAPESLAGTRIGWLGDLVVALPFETGVVDLCQAALRRFERLGCAVEDATTGHSMDSLWHAFTVLRAWQTAPRLLHFYRNPAQRSMLKPEAVFEIESGLALHPEDVWHAAEIRTAWYQEVRKLLDRYDILVLPSAQVFPFDASTPWPTEIDGRRMDTYHQWMAVMAPGTLSGCPIVAVPAGFDARGLPMGLQLIGRYGNEAACLRLAHAYDEVTRWVDKRPPEPALLVSSAHAAGTPELHRSGPSVPVEARHGADDRVSATTPPSLAVPGGSGWRPRRALSASAPVDPSPERWPACGPAGA